ncbi:MAG: PLDc N-terminal domain-containing protein, partial [Spirochaetales bacterium]|nr:PLDc N-terminal domain-containing protein [Spirochaetales bacterium]
MRRLLKLVTGRFFWTFVFIFLQIGVVALTLALVQNRFGLAAVNSLLGIVISLLIFARNDVPEYKLSWILLIMVVPIFGCSMYLIFGNKKKGIVQQKRMDRYHELTSEHVIDVFPGSLKPEDVLNPDECRLSRYVSGLSDSRVYSNTTVDYYALGDDCFPEMVKEIEKAERFIFMEYFIYEKGLFWDTILDILKKKVAAGVEVLLMYDDMGSIGTLPLG